MAVFSSLDNEPANTANLWRLFWLRNIAIYGQIVVLILVSALGLMQSRGIQHIELAIWDFDLEIGTLREQLPVVEIVVVIAVLGLFNLLSWRRLQRGAPVAQRELLLQLLVDVFALTGLLYLSGGATNPFIVLYLLPVGIAATVLSARYTWLLAGITVGCYTLLMAAHLPLPRSHAVTHDFTLHLIGSWLAYIIIAALVAYYIVHMGNTIRQQDRELSTAREQAMRNDQLVALGSLAASTAHELGTPLSTLALLIDELALEEAEDPLPGRCNTDALREQIDRCKAALSTLSASAGTIHLAGGGPMAIDRYLANLLADWQQIRPAAYIHTHWQGVEPPPIILAELTLSHAMVSILDNAADVSPEHIEWDANWTADELIMEVRDRGPGLSMQAQSGPLGEQPFSDKPQGMGLGLFLAHGIFGRFGGQVTLRDRAAGGIKTVIKLPLGGLLADIERGRQRDDTLNAGAC